MQRKCKIFYFVIIIIFLSLATGAFIDAKTEVLFAPADKPTKRLITLIDQAKKKIHAAVYMITDKNIAQALVRAKNRNVNIHIITDKITAESNYGKALFLKNAGIAVSVFFPHPTSFNTYLQTSPIMHHKFALIDDAVWTGSFNWTVSANRKNMENVLFTDDQDVYKSYEKEFQELKKKCSKQKKRTNKKTTERITRKRSRSLSIR